MNPLTLNYDTHEHRRTHGPLIHERAAQKVALHVSDAISRGASLVHGGSPLPSLGSPSFFSPTILADVPPTALVCSEETFGPLAALTKFETEDEVISMANNAQVGLAGYFYSRDVGRVWRVAEALEVGMVGTNTGAVSQAVVPFGGVKESGLGECFVSRLRSKSRLVACFRCLGVWDTLCGVQRAPFVRLVSWRP